MSLSDSERLVSTNLPISELIKHIKHSFRERDFNEVQSILMDRENHMKMEIENLVRDRDSARKEALLVERNGDLVELERLKLEEKLQKVQRKCEELEETATRLLEEKRMSNDREKRAKERYDKIFAEILKMASEKNKLSFELNEKINGLKNKNLESEQLVGVYREKCKCLEMKLVKMDQEIEDLRREKLDADQALDGLRRKQLESDQVVEELKRQNLEADKTINELRLKTMEADKEAELYKSRLENLSPRMKQIEENLADYLAVKVGDLANIVNDAGKFATSDERGHLDFADIRGKRDSSGNDSTPDVANVMLVDVVSPGVGGHSTSNSTGSSSRRLSKKGYRSSVQPRARDDDAHKVKNSPGTQSGCKSPQAEINEPKEPSGSGANASGTRAMFGARCTSKSAPSPSAGEAIIQIIDSDDETNADKVAHIPNKGMSYTGKNRMNVIQSPSPRHRSKRDKTDHEEGNFGNSTTKRKRNTRPRNVDFASTHEEKNQTLKPTDDRSLSRRSEEKARPACVKQTPPKKFSGLNDEDPACSDDESLSDSRMNELVASLWSEKPGRKFVYEADMLRAFLQDDELCLNAVCALYRQQVVARKSKGRSGLSKNGGFSPVDSTSGCSLAEYLIDGEPELRLQKSVSEVKRQRPEVISQCRKLANTYIEKLFAIYCAGCDPLFGHS